MTFIIIIVVIGALGFAIGRALRRVVDDIDRSELQPRDWRR